MFIVWLIGGVVFGCAPVWAYHRGRLVGETAARLRLGKMLQAAGSRFTAPFVDREYMPPVPLERVPDALGAYRLYDVAFSFHVLARNESDALAEATAIVQHGTNNLISWHEGENWRSLLATELRA